MLLVFVGSRLAWVTNVPHLRTPVVKTRSLRRPCPHHPSHRSTQCPFISLFRTRRTVAHELALTVFIMYWSHGFSRFPVASIRVLFMFSIALTRLCDDTVSCSTRWRVLPHLLPLSCQLSQHSSRVWAIRHASQDLSIPTWIQSRTHRCHDG